MYWGREGSGSKQATFTRLRLLRLRSVLLQSGMSPDRLTMSPAFTIIYDVMFIDLQLQADK